MNSYKEKNPGSTVWSIMQIVVIIYIVCTVLGMIATSTSSTFGVSLFFLMLWNIIILIGIFVFFILNRLFFRDSDLFHGLFVGVSFMAGLNILIEAIVFIAECVILNTITDATFARIMYIVLAIVSIILAVFEFVYVKSALYSKK